MAEVEAKPEEIRGSVISSETIEGALAGRKSCSLTVQHASRPVQLTFSLPNIDTTACLALPVAGDDVILYVVGDEIFQIVNLITGSLSVQISVERKFLSAGALNYIFALFMGQMGFKPFETLHWMNVTKKIGATLENHWRDTEAWHRHYQGQIQKYPDGQQGSFDATLVYLSPVKAKYYFTWKSGPGRKEEDRLYMRLLTANGSYVDAVIQGGWRHKPLIGSHLSVRGKWLQGVLVIEQITEIGLNQNPVTLCYNKGASASCGKYSFTGFADDLQDQSNGFYPDCIRTHQTQFAYSVRFNGSPVFFSAPLGHIRPGDEVSLQVDKGDEVISGFNKTLGCEIRTHGNDADLRRAVHSPRGLRNLQMPELKPLRDKAQVEQLMLIEHISYDAPCIAGTHEARFDPWYRFHRMVLRRDDGSFLAAHAQGFPRLFLYPGQNLAADLAPIAQGLYALRGLGPISGEMTPIMPGVTANTVKLTGYVHFDQHAYLQPQLRKGQPCKLEGDVIMAKLERTLAPDALNECVRENPSLFILGKTMQQKSPDSMPGGVMWGEWTMVVRDPNGANYAVLFRPGYDEDFPNYLDFIVGDRIEVNNGIWVSPGVVVAIGVTNRTTQAGGTWPRQSIPISQARIRGVVSTQPEVVTLWNLGTGIGYCHRSWNHFLRLERNQSGDVNADRVSLQMHKMMENYGKQLYRFRVAQSSGGAITVNAEPSVVGACGLVLKQGCSVSVDGYMANGVLLAGRISI